MKNINLTSIIITLIIALSVIGTTVFLCLTMLGNDQEDSSQGTDDNGSSGNLGYDDGYVDPDGWTDPD